MLVAHLSLGGAKFTRIYEMGVPKLWGAKLPVIPVVNLWSLLLPVLCVTIKVV